MDLGAGSRYGRRTGSGKVPALRYGGGSRQAILRRVRRVPGLKCRGPLRGPGYRPSNVKLNLASVSTCVGLPLTTVGL